MDWHARAPVHWHGTRERCHLRTSQPFHQVAKGARRNTRSRSWLRSALLSSLRGGPLRFRLGCSASSLAGAAGDDREPLCGQRVGELPALVLGLGQRARHQHHTALGETRRVMPATWRRRSRSRPRSTPPCSRPRRTTSSSSMRPSSRKSRGCKLRCKPPAAKWPQAGTTGSRRSSTPASWAARQLRRPHKLDGLERGLQKLRRNMSPTSGTPTRKSREVRDADAECDAQAGRVHV